MDFEKIAGLLVSQNIYNSASELHGIISGLLCAGAAVNPDTVWQLLGGEGSVNELVRGLVMRLEQGVAEQLQANDFSFHALLPDDEEELNLRVYALARWCEAFNLGFGAGFAGADSSILGETREVLKDFSAIAEVDEAGQEDGEQDEEAYMQLVEYVRMAATSVYLQKKVTEKRDLNTDIENGSGNFH